MGAVLGSPLLDILVLKLVGKGLMCIPRVRTANLGNLNKSYFIGGE